MADEGDVVGRVWFQSFTDPVAHEPYLTRLSAYLADMAGPGVRYDVHGMSPPDVHIGRLSEYRCGAQAIAAAVTAERLGYDAVLFGHFQDAGLWEARSAVDIPVLGLGESSMLHACALAARIGLVAIDPVYVPWHREQIRRYGLGERVVAVASMGISPDALVAALDDEAARDEILRRFTAAAEPMVATSSVELVMSAGGLFAALTARERDLRVGGAAVVNPTLLAVKQTEAAIAVANLGGVGASRTGTFAKAAPEAVRELLALDFSTQLPARQ